MCLDFSPPCSTCHEVDCDQFNNEKGLYKIENMDPMLCHCGPVTCHGPGSWDRSSWWGLPCLCCCWCAGRLATVLVVCLPVAGNTAALSSCLTPISSPEACLCKQLPFSLASGSYLLPCKFAPFLQSSGGAALTSNYFAASGWCCPERTSEIYQRSAGLF